MKIELDKTQIDAVVAAQIAALEKQIKSLEKKLSSREEKIAKMQNGMDLTKETRSRISELAESIHAELEDAGWVAIDQEDW